MTREEFRKIVLMSSRKYRAIEMLMLTGFMGYREFNVFNRSEEVKKRVLSGADLIKVDLPPRKKGKPFYTFVGGDGLKALNEYLEYERGPIRAGEALVVNNRGGPMGRSAIRQYVTRVADACGIIEIASPKCVECGGKTRKKVVRVETEDGRRRRRLHYVCLQCGHVEPSSEEYRVPISVRYRVKPHEIRDTAKTLWYRSGTNEKWMADFFSGRTDQVDPNEYLKAMKHYPDWMEDTYREVLPWLNVLTEDPEKVPARDFRRLQQEVLETRKEIQEAYRLLNNSAVQKFLRGLAEKETP